jgi:hypothetical protein
LSALLAPFVDGTLPQNVYSLRQKEFDAIPVPFGPVPDQYDLWISTLIAENPTISKDEVWINDSPAEIIISKEAADIGVFENSEVLVLASVREFFKSYTAKMITDFSHKEKGYQETKNGQIISYQYAKDLRI